MRLGAPEAAQRSRISTTWLYHFFAEGFKIPKNEEAHRRKEDKGQTGFTMPQDEYVKGGVDKRCHHKPGQNKALRVESTDAFCPIVSHDARSKSVEERGADKAERYHMEDVCEKKGFSGRAHYDANVFHGRKAEGSYDCIDHCINRFVEYGVFVYCGIRREEFEEFFHGRECEKRHDAQARYVVRTEEVIEKDLRDEREERECRAIYERERDDPSGFGMAVLPQIKRKPGKARQKSQYDPECGHAIILPWRPGGYHAPEFLRVPMCRIRIIRADLYIGTVLTPIALS